MKIGETDGEYKVKKKKAKQTRKWRANKKVCLSLTSNKRKDQWQPRSGSASSIPSNGPSIGPSAVMYRILASHDTKLSLSSASLLPWLQPIVLPPKVLLALEALLLL